MDDWKGITPNQLDDQLYNVRICHDINKISLIFENFDAVNAAAVMCIRDRFGNMNTIYCGNPVYAMICFSSLINRCLRESSINLETFMTLDEYTEKFTPMAYEDANDKEHSIDDSVLLTSPRSGKEAVSVDMDALYVLDDVKRILSQYQAPDETWCLSACVNGKTACVLNSEFSQILQPLRFAIGHFISNADCPFCGGKMDFQHFMKHISDIQGRTTDC